MVTERVVWWGRALLLSTSLHTLVRGPHTAFASLSFPGPVRSWASIVFRLAADWMLGPSSIKWPEPSLIGSAGWFAGWFSPTSLADQPRTQHKRTGEVTDIELLNYNAYSHYCHLGQMGCRGLVRLPPWLSPT